MAEPLASTAAGLEIVRSVAALRARIGVWHAAGETVGLVPTMGALHEGHVALVRRAGALCDHVVASLFVNPTQFGPNEDFARYPRDEAADARQLKAGGCELLFAPTVGEMYPPGFSTAITVGAIADGLCGPFRPGHFAGVATVVAKLLLQARPDIACFGEKDYQQLQVIKRMVRDLDLPVRIEGVPTVREPDGLALSSRNRYLAPGERSRAVAIFHVLTAIAKEVGAGNRPIESALARGRDELAAAGFAPIDYLAICDAVDLTPLTILDRPGRVFAAVWLGKTRLIDNLAIAPA
ncbi:MAG TPA: pantoate--beta-alanine ligase [Stellaceae bacterium]|jgi:pantoate--beta-alanine ligase|nr:pantoate--beta-alanine ligase [Stellaceae bacterium]